MNVNHLFNITQNLTMQTQKSFSSVTQAVAKQMGQHILQLYNHLEKFKEEENSFQKYTFPTLDFQSQTTQSPVCAKILTKGTKAFKCHDCMYESNSILCMECFQNSDHKGHIYQLVPVFGGCCDCGDQEKWNPKGSCKKHSNSNLVDQFKEKVNPIIQKKFINQLGFCLIYWFLLYNQCQKVLKAFKGNEAQNLYVKIMKDTDKFGVSLMNYLIKFNQKSLISNIMTFNLLNKNICITQYLKKQKPFSFCKFPQTLTFLQMILKVTKLVSSAQSAVNLFTQLFTIRQFKFSLTKIFFKFYNEDHQFAISGFSHLSCQLMTSHKLIRQLVQKQEILPLSFMPPLKNVNSFEDLAQKVVRFFIDIEYLSKLYKQSAEIYLSYHIKKGYLPLLGYYRSISYHLQQSINYYGIQEIFISKIIKILKVIINSKDRVFIIEKGIQDLFNYFNHIYQKQCQGLLSQQFNEQKLSNFSYLTQQIAFSLFVFAYFEILDEQNLPQKQKVLRLIKILNLSNNQISSVKLKNIISTLNNSLTFSALTLGHPETTQRFFTYYSFTFRKSLSIFSLTLYCYKIVVLLTLELFKQNDKQIYEILMNNRLFNRPLSIVEEIMDLQSFKDDDESIFDRKKAITRLTYFLNVIIEASETDFHELKIANLLNIKKEKYDRMLQRLYVQLLKNYGKMNIKQFKEAADSLLVDEERFERFVGESKQINIVNGKISLKEELQSDGNENKKQARIQSQMNLFYFKSLKNKLVNINEKEVVMKVPLSSNHFLHHIISFNFISKLIKIINSYISIIIMEGGKIKQKQSGVLGQLLIELIKINKTFKLHPNTKISEAITKNLKILRQKKNSLNIFTQDVIKLICIQVQQQQSHQSIQSLNKQVSQKAEQRKKLLQIKKNKKLAKFKENQQKYQQKYSNQLRNIKQQIDQQNQNQKEINEEKHQKICIICRQSRNQGKSYLQSDLMLMGFMQLSDLYHYFLKGKQEKNNNCHHVFKSCGHYIHLQCYNKINGNKEYSNCQLCKASVNSLFPVCIEQYEEWIKREQDQKIIEQVQGHIFKMIEDTSSRLYTIDVLLRENCENGLGQNIEDQRDIHQKLVESIVNQITFNLTVHSQLQDNFFQKKQAEVYQNIMSSIKVFIVLQNKLNRNLPQKIKQLNELKSIQNDLTTLQNNQQTQIIQDQKKQKLRCLTRTIQDYIKEKMYKYLYQKQTKKCMTQGKLSQQCLKEINYFLDQIIPFKKCIQNKIITQNQEKIQVNQNESNKQSSSKIMQRTISQQQKYLNQSIQLYNPPQSLQKLFQERGKCPNCMNITNHLLICFICKWKGCRECKSQSIYQHNNKIHNGNSIYISADIGNIYFVSRKKYWMFGSIYQDYLGNGFSEYKHGINLQRYAVNKHKLQKLRKNIMNYQIESIIRYEQFNKKRQFVGVL